MFNNIGAKIKCLAKGTFIVESLASFITGIVFWCLWGDIEGFLMFLAIGVGGFLVSWISSWFIYGFGELIENTGATVLQLKSTANSSNYTFNSSLHQKPAIDESKCKNNSQINKKDIDICGCKKTKKQPSDSFDTCEKCGKKDESVTRCFINHETGFQSLCDDCKNS